MSAARRERHIRTADETFDDTDEYHQYPEDPHTHVHEHDERTRVTTTGRTWSPAQLVAGVIGLLFVVLGGVTMLRTGFTALDATAFVGWYDQTLLFGILEVILGLLFLGAAATTYGARSSTVSLGVLMIAFGLISVIEPGAMARWVGDAYVAGITFLVIGAIALIAGWASPVLSSSGTRRVDTDAIS